jgi:hypothetical protein
MDTNYKADAEQAQKNLQDMLSQKDELEIRIARQQRRLAALITLAENSDEETVNIDLRIGGLTESVISVLKSILPEFATPSQITIKLEQIQFPVADYKNFRGTLHTVLLRLHKSGKIIKVPYPAKEGEFMYQWTGDGWMSRTRSGLPDSAGMLPSPESIKLWSAMKARAIKNK